MAEYIEREAAIKLLADACSECEEACEEFDGIYPDCEQCLLHGVKINLFSIPAANVRENVMRTNADRIRAMTDEELARFIFHGCDGRKCVEPGDNESIPHQCERCWLEWLQQEVEQ